MFGCAKEMTKIGMYIENEAFMAVVVKGKNGRIIEVVGYNEKRQRESDKGRFSETTYQAVDIQK